MGKKEISKYRSEVIEKFINIEWLINVIISQHYLKTTSESFLFDFLYDEYCSFGLKRRILKKIIELDPIEENLNRLNTIRNYFCHCNQRVQIPQEGNKEKIIDPRDKTKEIDFEKLYNEFNKKEPKVSEYLAETFKNIGGKIV